MLVYAIPVETNTGFNKIDFMDAKVEEMKEKMTELITWDPTLEPDTIVDKLLNDFTDNLEGQAKRELAAYTVYSCSLVLGTFNLLHVVYDYGCIFCLFL